MDLIALLSSNFNVMAVIAVIVLCLYFIVGAGKINKLIEKFFNFKNDTAVLNEFSSNFVELAKKGMIDPIIGRDEEVEKLTRVLLRKNKNNAILVGEPGVGKTAIVEGLALKIVKEEVPTALCDKVILSLEVSKLLSDTKYRGEFEKRIRKIIEEISETKQSIILFIDEIHSIIQSHGTEGSVNFADILKPALARGNLHMIGATTTEEYNRYIKSNPSLERRFQPIEIKETSLVDTLLILQGVKDKYRQYHRVEFTDAALEVAVKESSLLIKNRQLPDKALDAIDEAAAMIKVKHIDKTIPWILFQVAAKMHPEAVEIWQKIQEVDNKISRDKKSQPNGLLVKERENLEKKLENMGLEIVDSDDVKKVVNDWLF